MTDSVREAIETAQFRTTIGDTKVYGGFPEHPNQIAWINKDGSPDSQRFPDGGHVVGFVVWRGHHLILLESAVILMVATGDEYVFQFDVVDRGFGLRKDHIATRLETLSKGEE